MAPLPRSDPHTWETLEGVEKGRGGKSQQGTPHIRTVAFPLLAGLSPVWVESESKLSVPGVAFVVGWDTPAAEKLQIKRQAWTLWA